VGVETASAEGLRLVGHHDLGGHGDGMQVLRSGDALFVGHFGTSGMGTSILDVSDPAAPKLVRQWPAPPNTHTHKVQVAEGLLLVNHEVFPYGSDPPPGERSAGMAVYRLDDPFEPAPAGFWESTGRGVHRIVWTGGRHAYLSATPEGYDDRIWVIVDLDDPASPTQAGRWWWPGQRRGAGERPTWPAGQRIAAHHALLDGRLAYLGYDDANLVVLDVSDPRRPELVGNLRWDGGGTHTCLPLPRRRLVVATDEQLHSGPEAPERLIRVIDVADPARPRVLAVCPPPEEAYREAGLRFGPHNLHENRPGTYASERLVFATYFNAGVRVYDLEEPTRPREVAHWVPHPAPGQPAAQSNDLLVDADGLIYVTDRVGGGLAVLEPEPALAELMDRSRTSANPQ
jgi:hypothetical protein